MKPFIHTVGRVKTIVNGDILEDSMVDATYNGNKLDINAFDKGTEKHIQLTNNDIMKLLSKPASDISLEKRLLHDFDMNVKQTKKSKQIQTRRYKKTQIKKNKKNKTKKFKK
jgi:hypothetical protein